MSIETNPDYSVLTIKNANASDSGVYSIMAENVVGKAMADFEVSIKGRLYIMLIKQYNFFFFFFLI